MNFIKLICIYNKKKLEDEKSAMQNQNSDVQGDLNSLRKEILAAEQTRLDLEADKSSYAERIKFLESEKEKVFIL